MTKKQKTFTEVIQFVPVIIFAFSFLVKGDVDLNRAQFLFLISGIIAAIITAFLLIKKIPINPILLGTNMWLVLGAISFSIPIPLLADLIGKLQAVGLYICVFVVGIVLMFIGNSGFIGMSHQDSKLIRKLSLIMLFLVIVVLIWSYLWIDNIRIGGGLPFILLNVTRRIIITRYQLR